MTISNGRAVVAMVTALIAGACGSGAQNDVDRMSTAVVAAADGFDAGVAAYTPDPVEWEYCVPNPVIAELDLSELGTLVSAGSVVSLDAGDRTGRVEILVFDDPATVVEVANLYDWWLSSRRECLASNADADRILGGVTDDREFTTVDVARADAAFSARFSNRTGKVAYVDVALASTGTGVVIVSFTSASGPVEPEVMEDIVAASLAAG